MFQGSDNRQKLGTFAVVAMACFVCGVIGSGYLQKPKPFPIVEEQASALSLVPPTTPSPGSSTSPGAPQTGQQVSINTGTLAELDTLPGVGPVIAQRIIEYRERIKGFKSLEEIKGVKGIGEGKYAKMLPLITL